MLKWIPSDPVYFLSRAIGVVGYSSDRYLAKRELQFSVYQRMLSGSKPDIQYTTTAILRPQGYRKRDSSQSQRSLSKVQLRVAKREFCTNIPMEC